MDPLTRVVDFDDDKYTQNTRLCYPIEFMANAKAPLHPPHLITAVPLHPHSPLAG